MSQIEASTPATAVTPIGGFNAMQRLGDLGRMGQRSDLLLATAVMGIIVLLIVPLPAMVLD
jgi:flagellar biosynthesis component FlhA